MDGGESAPGRGGVVPRRHAGGLSPGASTGASTGASSGLSQGAAAGLTALAVALWGFSPIGTRYMVGDANSALPALAFNGVRYIAAALCFAPFLWGTRKWAWRDWRLGVVCGLVGVCGYNLPATLGQRTVSAGLTGLLDGAEPLMIVVFTALLARRRPGVWTMTATVIALAGVVLLARGAGPAQGTAGGIALVLLGAVLWAGYCVLVPPLISGKGALPATAVTMMAGALPMLASGAPQTPHLLHVMTLLQWEVLASLVVGCSVFSMLCWNAGSAVLGAEKAGWFLYLLPLVSLAGGAVLLHEPVTWSELVGGGLLLLAVYLSQVKAAV